MKLKLEHSYIKLKQLCNYCSLNNMFTSKLSNYLQNKLYNFLGKFSYIENQYNLISNLSMLFHPKSMSNNFYQHIFDKFDYYYLYNNLVYIYCKLLKMYMINSSVNNLYKFHYHYKTQLCIAELLKMYIIMHRQDIYYIYQLLGIKSILTHMYRILLLFNKFCNLIHKRCIYYWLNLKHIEVSIKDSFKFFGLYILYKYNDKVNKFHYCKITLLLQQI